MKTSHSSPNCAHANDKAEPHWLAPVSVTIFLVPDFVVIGLGQSGVGFVRTTRAYPFVFVVNARRRVEVLFEIMGPEEWRGPVLQVFVANLLRNLDQTLGRHLLRNERLGKQRS